MYGAPACPVSCKTYCPPPKEMGRTAGALGARVNKVSEYGEKVAVKLVAAVGKLVTATRSCAATGPLVSAASSLGHPKRYEPWRWPTEKNLRQGNLRGITRIAILIDDEQRQRAVGFARCIGGHESVVTRRLLRLVQISAKVAKTSNIRKS